MTKPIPRRAEQLLSPDEYAARLESQGGVCAICGNPPAKRKLSVDHDHATGLVRGLLCFRCNRALPAYLKADWLLRAFAYLEPVEAAMIRYALDQIEQSRPGIRVSEALLPRGSNDSE